MRFLFLLTLLISCSVHATLNHQEILCPPLPSLQQAANKIADASFVNGAYIAATYAFAIHASGLRWFAVVYQIKANSKKEAMTAATIALKKVGHMDDTTAQNAGGIYYCFYDRGKIEVISSRDDGLKGFNTISLPTASQRFLDHDDRYKL
jgi:hypothetical protein